MNNNFKVSFYLSGRPKKSGKDAILYRIHFGFERLPMGSTGFSVFPSQWSIKDFRVIGNDKDACYINNALYTMESDLRTIFRRLEFSESFSLELVKSTYLHRDEKPVEKSFLSYFDKKMERKKEEVGCIIVLGTYKKYRTTRKCFETYLNNKLHRKDVAFHELNYKLMTDFDRYLLVECGVKNNTAKGRLKCIRALINEAIREGVISENPCKDVHMNYSPTDRGFLTEEEVEKIMSYDFRIERLEKVRDFFVFSCFTGLAYTDICALTYDNIVAMGERMWIVKSREKTHVASNVPLLPIPLQIIEKYRGRAKDNHVFPMMTNQRMNSYLKEIADVCGITKNLTFHLARHTFGTLMVSLGVPFDSVSKMMGHTNMKTTMIYARITNKKIGEDMDKMAEKLEYLNGTLANMPDNIQRGESKTESGNEIASISMPVNTCNEQPVKRGRPRKQPADNLVQQLNGNIPLNVQSIRYMNGKMVITCDNGQTFIMNSNIQQANP